MQIKTFYGIPQQVEKEMNSWLDDGKVKKIKKMTQSSLYGLECYICITILYA